MDRKLQVTLDVTNGDTSANMSNTGEKRDKKRTKIGSATYN